MAACCTPRPEWGRVGGGLTWASPFGALSVTYAAPITKASYDVVQPLGFNASPF